IDLGGRHAVDSFGLQRDPAQLVSNVLSMEVLSIQVFSIKGGEFAEGIVTLAGRDAALGRTSYESGTLEVVHDTQAACTGQHIVVVIAKTHTVAVHATLGNQEVVVVALRHAATDVAGPGLAGRQKAIVII